jgi:hypothetical protein
MKFTVFQIDYHERSFRIGAADTLDEARKIARKAFRKSRGEFPCFIMSAGQCVADIR